MFKMFSGDVYRLYGNYYILFFQNQHFQQKITFSFFYCLWTKDVAQCTESRLFSEAHFAVVRSSNV